MKHLIAFILLFATALLVRAEEMITTSGCLKIEHTDSLKWIQRDAHAVRTFEQQDASANNLSCDVLFVGSSSFRMWTTLEQDMAPLTVINRSYGGSCIRDILYYYDSIVKRFTPRKIILYVENDLSGSSADTSVGDAYDLFRLFAQKVQGDFPDVTLYIVSIKPSFAREKERTKTVMLNTLLKEYCENNDHLVFIDITRAMFDETGKLRDDLFLADRLHLNAKGYALWTGIIKPYLIDKQ